MKNITKVDPDAHTFHSPQFQSVVSEALSFFEDTPVHVLPPPSRFLGGGVYALYYRGNNELYRPISKVNKSEFALPIYVGKAVPTGWRTGRSSKGVSAVLFLRLKQHAHSIEKASDLRAADFFCRFMILTDVEADLIAPIEAELIRHYKPVWNSVIDGFGIHDPGQGRYKQARSEWDVLHPGRKWGASLEKDSSDRDSIVKKLTNALGDLSLLQDNH